MRQDEDEDEDWEAEAHVNFSLAASAEFERLRQSLMPKPLPWYIRALSRIKAFFRVL